jgi:glycosyltransferase involved in cell wall biosynthesis
MGRLVFITQTYRTDSTILGVTRDWVRALAARSDGVDVIALDGVRELGDERVRVHDLGKGTGGGRAVQLARFYRALAMTLRGAQAVLVHMVPRYALLAFPLARALRRPIALWYAQGGVDGMLREAVGVVDHILTPTRDSFPLTGRSVERRLCVTGHGVDTGRYAPGGTVPAERGLILAAGRLSPAKRYEFLIDSLRRVHTADWRLRIASGGGYSQSRAHAKDLSERIERHGMGERIALLGAVGYEDMPVEYRRAWLLGHTSGTGSLDKVVLEAMACGTPVVSSAQSSRSLLAPVDSSLAPTDADEASYASALEDVLRWSETRRAEVGQALRRQVDGAHSLRGWADQVAALLLG